MSDLGQRVAVTIDELELPSDDLVARVLDDLLINPEQATTNTGRLIRYRGRLRNHDGRRLTVAVALAAVAFVVSLVALEPARSAVADILGFGATRIEQDRTTPPATATPPEATPQATTPSTTAPAATDDPAPLAADRLNPLPSLGQPLVSDGATASRRSYFWPASEEFPRLIDSEFGVALEVRDLSGPPDLKRLGAQPGSEFITVTVESGETLALWIPFEHQRELDEAAGPTTVDSTLLWTVDELQYRLQASVDLERAVELAAEVQGGTELLAAG
ncbi:MAG: hypothetical protein ACRBK7_10105 [Acidimicrobiales bacterium]